MTVAAFLAHTEMFFHILNIDRDIYWQVTRDSGTAGSSLQIGNVVCAAYPLTVVDTIDVHTGELNERSALNMIVFGVGDSIGQSLDGKPFSEERGTLGHD